MNSNDTLFLAIDDVSLPVKKYLCYYLTKPEVRAEPILVPEPLESNAPDNQAAMFYGSVLHEAGRFRMWYHACHKGLNPDWTTDQHRQLVNYKDPFYMGPVCYAESDDGIHWHKPALGVLPFKGDSHNNGLDLPHTVTCGAAVIRDDNDADPSRRYKMAYQFFPRYSEPLFEEYGRTSTIATAVSPDGIHWRLTGVPYRNQFVEHCALYQFGGRYIVGYQTTNAWGSHFSDGSHESGRIGQTRFSYDFDNWIDGFVESLALPEPRDPDKRGGFGSYDQNHMGVAPAVFGNVCVGVYGLWHAGPQFEDASCDLGLAVSNDGLTFREPVKGHVLISSVESACSPAAKHHYNTNLCQGNGILNVGDETRIYHSRWRNTGIGFIEDYYGEIALATLPRDRWGGLGLFAKENRGHVWSTPVTLTGGNWTLTLNAEDAGGLRIEITDEQFRSIPEFSGENAGVPEARAGLDIAVKWPEALERLAGRTIRFKLLFDKGNSADPRLFAMKLSA